LVSLYAQGTGPDDLYYEFSAEGQGSLSASVNSAGTAASMVISGAGSGYGQAKSSDAGVSQGKFTLKGSGKPETLVPYSIYWWNVLD
jgi:hypothetical protein